MKRFSDISLKWQLLTILLAVIVIPITFMSIFSVTKSREGALKELMETLGLQSITASDALKAQMSKAKTDINNGLLVLDDALQIQSVAVSTELAQTMTITDQVTSTGKTTNVPELLINGSAAASYTAGLDKIQKNMGGAATIFQVIPEGMLRVATNVKKADGNRAVGTYIPKDSPVYQAIMDAGKAVISESSEVVSKALASLGGMGTQVKTIEAAIETVSSVAQQSASSSQQMSAAVQQTSSSMQQVSSAAQQLAASAQELDGLVKQFKV